MKVVSTSFVNVLSTSSNDVVSASYIGVETTSKTRCVWKLDRRQLSTFCRRRVTTLFLRHISTSKQRWKHVVYEDCIDVVSMSYTDLGDCNELKGPPETPLPNVDSILLEE